MICKEPESKLTQDSARGGRDFDCSIGSGGQSTGLGEVDITNHDIGEVYCKDIVSVRVTGWSGIISDQWLQSNASHDNSTNPLVCFEGVQGNLPNVVPGKFGVINLL